MSPCLRALRAEMALPSALIGPRDLDPLARAVSRLRPGFGGGRVLPPALARLRAGTVRPDAVREIGSRFTQVRNQGSRPSR